MPFTKEQQKFVLVALITVIILINGYRFLTGEKPKTAPLVYAPGAVATSPVRQGMQSRTGGADPLSVFIERRNERFPGVSRDIFRMENIAKPKPNKPAVVATAPSPTLPPPVPQRTPEEIAADLARADLSKFRYLGYLTEKDNTLFLSDGSELFIVKVGDNVIKSYKVKEANKDSVVLLDTVTRVEVRAVLAGEGTQAKQQPVQLPQPLQQRSLQPQPSVQPPVQPQPAKQGITQPPDQPLTRRRLRPGTNQNQ
jgi:hypothetical protein